MVEGKSAEDNSSEGSVAETTAPRIGLYGGTFDPVHRGHIQLACAAVEEIALDKVLFLPAVHPPHKSEQSHYQHRLAMLRLALLQEAAGNEDGEEREKFIVDTIEEQLPRPSYSINTITAIKVRCPQAELFFILGFDSLLDIKNWHGWEEIVATVHLVVAQRQGYAGKESGNVEEYMAKLGYIPDKSGWKSEGAGKKIHLLDYIPPFISSSDIKTALHYGDEGFTAAQKMLYGDVVRYIVKHQLYR